jgi:hypothetical protein
VSDPLDRAIALLDGMGPDPVEQERLRRLSLLALLRARGIAVSNAEAMDSAALARELKRHSPHLYPSAAA